MRIQLSRAFRFTPAGPALAAALLCLASTAGPAQTPPASAQGAAALSPVNRFEGSAKFQGKNGQSRDARVTIHQWSIPPKQKVDALAEHGFLLVSVRAGKVNVTINGKTEQHRTEDMWTVPENAKMSVEAPGEAAILEVVSFTVR